MRRFPLPLSSMLLLLSLAFVLVEAQIQVPDCLPAAKKNWNWTYNSLEQAPCSTAGYLAAQCGNGQFTIPQLAAGNHYTGPSGGSDDGICQCNSVLYSLISGCAGCQKGTWLSYDEWTANCSSRAAMSTFVLQCSVVVHNTEKIIWWGRFPQSISNSTRVPAWAFLNVSTSQPWDNITACNFGGSPESVGTFRPSFAPQYSSGAALSAGVIAGLVAGTTVAGLAAIAAGVWYLVRRRRKRRTPQSNIRPTSTGASTQDNSGYESVPWTPQSDMKFYNPSDPSTYPNLAVIPGNPTNAAAMTTMTSLTTANDSKASSGANPHRTTYLGLPEV
ncbi:hypothetical protein EDB89DRAFT_2031093 [Lactarius sanguifluus]|nr:hypothetical protein EDB89DRAFT_2031093 [Lactarius sanguifluus]